MKCTLSKLLLLSQDLVVRRGRLRATVEASRDTEEVICNTSFLAVASACASLAKRITSALFSHYCVPPKDPETPRIHSMTSL